MTTYSLTKQAREWKGKGMHATAVIQALQAFAQSDMCSSWHNRFAVPILC
jgi:hypothetical protein